MIAPEAGNRPVEWHPTFPGTRSSLAAPAALSPSPPLPAPPARHLYPHNPVGTLGTGDKGQRRGAGVGWGFGRVISGLVLTPDGSIPHLCRAFLMVRKMVD